MWKNKITQLKKKHKKVHHKGQQLLVTSNLPALLRISHVFDMGLERRPVQDNFST